LTAMLKSCHAASQNAIAPARSSRFLVFGDVEIGFIRRLSPHGIRVLPVQRVEVAGGLRDHLPAGDRDDVARGNRFLGDRRRRHDPELGDPLRRFGRVFVDELHGGRIFLEERVHRGRVLLGKRAAHEADAGDHRAAVAELLPLVGQAQRDARARVLHKHRRHIGLREHRDRRRVVEHRRGDLGGLRLVLDVDVLVRVEPVAAQDVVQRVLGRRALAGRVDSLPGEVGDRLDGLAVFDDVQYAQRVDRRNLQRAVRLADQYRREICRNHRRLELAADQQRGDRVRGPLHREGIVVRGLSGLRVVHQLHEAHRRRPLQRGDAQRRAGLFRNDLGGRERNRKNRDREHDESGKNLFHTYHPFDCLYPRGPARKHEPADEDQFDGGEHGKADRKAHVARLVPKDHHACVRARRAEQHGEQKQRPLGDAPIASPRAQLVQPHRNKGRRAHQRHRAK